MIENELHNIPDELREYPQWVLWKAENRSGHVTKVPHSVDGKHAKTTDRTTWSTFEAAYAAFTAANGTPSPARSNVRRKEDIVQAEQELGMEMDLSCQVNQ